MVYRTGLLLEVLTGVRPHPNEVSVTYFDTAIPVAPEVIEQSGATTASDIW